MLTANRIYAGQIERAFTTIERAKARALVDLVSKPDDQWVEKDLPKVAEVPTELIAELQHLRTKFDADLVSSVKSDSDVSQQIVDLRRAIARHSPTLTTRLDYV